jgi:hypothetical protein
MKSVPNLISYIHEFFWNFSQFLAIYLERFSFGVILIQKTLTSGSHLSDAVVCAGPAWQRAVAAWVPRAVPLQRVKSTVGTARRRPDSAVPTGYPKSPTSPRLGSPRPDRAVTAVRSRAAAVSESRRCLAVRRCRELRSR